LVGSLKLASNDPVGIILVPRRYRPWMRKVPNCKSPKRMPEAVSVNIVGPPVVRFRRCELRKEKPGLTGAAIEAAREKARTVGLSRRRQSAFQCVPKMKRLSPESSTEVSEMLWRVMTLITPKTALVPNREELGPRTISNVIDQIEIQRKLCADECVVEHVSFSR